MTDSLEDQSAGTPVVPPVAPSNDLEARLRGLQAKMDRDYVPKTERDILKAANENLQRQLLDSTTSTTTALSTIEQERASLAAQLTAAQALVASEQARAAAAESKLATVEVASKVSAINPLMGKMFEKGIFTIPADKLDDLEATVKAAADELGIAIVHNQQQRNIGSVPPPPALNAVGPTSEFQSMTDVQLREWLGNPRNIRNDRLWADVNQIYMKKVTKT